MVGPILGAPINWFALYLGAAVVVELVALTPIFKRPIVFGLVSGLAVGTVGLWLESLWIDAVYHYPWPSSIWPEALMMAVPVAVLTGACGAMLGMVLTGQRLPRRAIGIGLVALTVLVIGGATANGLRYEVPQNATATIDADGGAGLRRQADGDRRRADQPARPDQRGPELGVGPRLAGRPGQRPRHLHRPSARSSDPATTAPRSRCRCGASGRRCCVCTTARHPDRRADLSGRRSRHRRARRCRRSHR